MKQFIKLITISLLAAVLIFTGVKVSSVGAADTAQAVAFSGSDFGWRVSDEELAEALEISEEELQEAFTAAYSAAVEQALEIEAISEEEAEELKEEPSMRALLRLLTPQERAEIGLVALLAEELELSEEELRETIAGLVENDRPMMPGMFEIDEDQQALFEAMQALKDSESFRTNMQAAFAEAIQAEVEAGTLTQQQADLLLERMGEDGLSGWFGSWGSSLFERGMLNFKQGMMFFNRGMQFFDRDRFDFNRRPERGNMPYMPWFEDAPESEELPDEPEEDTEDTSNTFNFGPGCWVDF